MRGVPPAAPAVHLVQQRFPPGEGRETILAKLLNTFDSNYGFTQPSTKLFTTYVHTLYIQYLRLAERFAKQTMTMAEWNIAARVKKTAMGRFGPG